MADLPNLEVLGVSDTASHDPSDGHLKEPERSRGQLRASLITLAWGKTPNPGCLTEREEAGGRVQPNGTNLQQTICESNAGDELQYGNTKQMVSNGVAVNTSLSEDENRVQVLVAEDLLTSSTNSSSSEEQVSEHKQSNDVAVKLELKETEPNADESRESAVLQKTRPQRVCAVEREQTMRSLVELQRRVEQRQHRAKERARERQLLKVQERLSLIQSRKAEEDQLGLKDRLKLLTHDLPQEDIQQQKAVVKERLEQLRRERSYILQSKRDKNTAGFKELLGPAGLHHTKIKEDAD
ncbi:uncharacterized protein [Eucyclogobius newberryi]|uniref:uncharacterized protein n=1 Tax=Eucyclogobius newberryi TaxID=166745 RepID=UPI003B5CA0A2